VKSLLSGRRRVWVTIAATAALFALSGCGSSDQKSDISDTSSPAGWADGLCGAVGQWRTSIESVGATVKNVDDLSKAKLEQAATSLSDANSQLASSLHALGEPPHDAAPEAKAAVQQLSTDLKTSADAIRKAAADVSGANDFARAIPVASAALVTMSADISSTVTKLEGLDATDEWKRAFADSPACKKLKRS